MSTANAADVIEATTAATDINPAQTIWTSEMIYKDSVLNARYSPMPPPRGLTGRFTPEFNVALDSETNWVRIEDFPAIPKDLHQAVGTRKIKCPVCDDRDRGIKLLCKGDKTGIEATLNFECECTFLKVFWNYYSAVPPRFSAVELGTLVPHPGLAISEARQSKIIARLQANPSDSYLMVGPPNTGKTHLVTALYREALTQNVLHQLREPGFSQFSVWRVNATELMAQHSAWAVEQNKEFPDWRKEPVVTAKKIAAAVKHGFRPCLFIDELDKIAVTDYKLSALCDLINKIYEANGQIVAIINASPDQLAAKWGENEAGTILRRIGAGDAAQNILFKG